MRGGRVTTFHFPTDPQSSTFSYERNVLKVEGDRVSTPTVTVDLPHTQVSDRAA